MHFILGPRLLAAFAAVSFSLSTVACGSDAEQSDDEAVATEEALFGPARIEVFQGKDQKHYFRVVAGNGENVLASEAYESKQAAEKGLTRALENGTDEDRFEQRVSRDGQYYFVLKAANHVVLGRSELYVTRFGAERGARALRALFARLGP